MNERAQDFCVRVIEALDATSIPHMLVGSLSSNHYGIERSTKDADFVIQLEDRSIAPLSDRLKPEILIDRQISFESVTLVSRYEARHAATGFMIGFFLLSDDPFQTERFQRRVKVPFGPTFAFLPTAEDVIIQKLRWYARAKRTKDWDDARDVTNVQFLSLDLPYLKRWCDIHGTTLLLETLLSDAKKNNDRLSP